LLNSEQTKRLKKLNSESNLQHGRKLKLKDYHFLHFRDLLKKKLIPKPLPPNPKKEAKKDATEKAADALLK
jgi:hypothetical protein